MAELAHQQVNVVKGATEDIKHSFSDAEKVNFVDYINQSLKDDPHLQKVLPIPTETDAVFQAVKDGVLLSKLINKCVPGTIDERTLNLKEKKNVFEINENQNLVLESAKAIGCQVINIRPGDLVEAKPHLVLGLMWQIIKVFIAGECWWLEFWWDRAMGRGVLVWLGTGRRIGNVSSDLEDLGMCLACAWLVDWSVRGHLAEGEPQPDPPAGGG